jgi:hypothetical protein
MQPQLLLILREFIKYSGFLYLLFQRMIINFTWHRAFAVDEVPPDTHPFDGNYEVAVGGGHVRGVVRVLDSGIIILT